ncbi:OsmC family protein [Ponticoccus sp. SC2-23]|uniref:bifunctional alpha/beta hydrolase/OsmC family protein n=1 Tax=Alexandriicola marinus TaxID=2081710 RepID=UPI000FDC54BB|nr:bifunctional alpha/beta hydrolase/OsmC family protein [Alexandriicola marinus]MBM1222362.1 OsmC family protein [Ponticoccus sp. SC6-9]MBM1224475.1 OsmC family protein [Ponticoccus sp. SC6-15]MBM1229745.1 OsmC family protein [Ponticoccus sp. SC6-38]MBM1233441.1 OsmC family protein [Ponticoccus sp. SC6-45]MBM1236609.1 OsmC family protein [Ponticoccus sp. SC6-49]MBM1244653.1 OsmC family protein [Ponticoccus sp. SC2-64]MBM1246965.1 OsmC family protein [Ponticoccus sp. SC6-42]MBM1251443.1 Osm
MPTDRFTFPGHSGAALAARLDMPDGPHLATALFAHCFTCGKDIAAARRISARLASMGIAVLRFDFTGLGHSGGEFANTSFTTNVDDLVAAAKALEGRGMAPSLLVGHSLGGAAVLRAASDIASVRAVATIGAPSDPGHVTQNFGASLDEIHEYGQAEVTLAGRAFTIGRTFIEDVAAANLNPAIERLSAALLVLHSPRDAIVGIDNAQDIFLAARHPKSFVTLDDADHLLSCPDDADYAADVIAAWAGRYLDLRAPAPPPGVPEGIVRVSEADPDGFLQDIQAGPRHHVQADEPQAYGGSDLGMSPYGFLSSGLGACTAMTIRMYARRRKIALDHVSVDVSHNKVHAQDAEAGGTKLDVFTRKIRLTGKLSTAEREKLLEIADKCPVHRTLEAEARIETSLTQD